MAYNGPPQRHVAPSPKVLRKVQTLQQLNAVVAQSLFVIIGVRRVQTRTGVFIEETRTMEKEEQTPM